MQQQTKIVIDFQEIFNTSQESLPFSPSDCGTPELALNQHHEFTAPSTRKYLPYCSTTTAANDTTFDKPTIILMPEISSSSDSEPNARLLSTAALMSRKKASTSAQVRAVTERLNNPKRVAPPPSESLVMNASRKGGEPDLKVDLDENDVVSCKQSKKKPFTSRSSSDLGSCNIFQRLYFQSKLNFIKQKYRPDPAIAQDMKKPRHRKSSSSQYLKKYVPFYLRLESDINRSFEKMKMYEEFLPCEMKDGRAPFRPHILASRYSGKVKSRYLQDTFRRSRALDLRNSSLNSSLSTLNKSSQMIKFMEDHFSMKMHCIFVEEGENLVTISEKTIELLSQVEFQLLEVFIRYLDQNPIPVKQFSNYLQSYLQSLSTADKLKLRNHQMYIKHKYSPFCSRPSPKQSREGEKKMKKIVNELEDRKIRSYHSVIHKFI